MAGPASGTASRALPLFRQFFEKESSTYTYLLACPRTREAVLIDPVLETAERDAAFVKELDVNLLYAINTHCHADHITSTGLLKRDFFPTAKSAIGVDAEVEVADWFLKEGDRVPFGDFALKVVATPGHTGGCLTYVLDDDSMAFTGDTLLIRGCGRTDFQSGSAPLLFQSVRTKLFDQLPDSCLVYPAHDYKGRTCSSIGEEKQHNPRLGLAKTEAEFCEIMAGLGLPYPKKIDEALPANKVCGLFEVDEEKS